MPELNDQVLEQLRDLIASRRDSLVALRERMLALLEPMPIGVTLTDTDGEVCKILRLYSGASQFANRQWDITLKGWGAVTPGNKLLCFDMPDGADDDSAHYTRKDEPICLGQDSHTALRFASGTDTRAIAGRLAPAIAKYMAECEAEIAANAATLA